MPPKIKKDNDNKTLKKVIKKEKIKKTKNTPPITDPLRKFYTSLLEQKPDSKMAIEWCIKYNLYDEIMMNIQIKKLNLK